MLEEIKNMIKQNGIATILIICSVAGLAIIAGIASVHWLGPDNVIEEEAEVIVQDLAEETLKAPKGSLHDEVDAMFPHKDKAKDK